MNTYVEKQDLIQNSKVFLLPGEIYFSKLSFKPASEIRKAEHSLSVNFGNVCPLYIVLLNNSPLYLLSLIKKQNFAGIVN